MKVIQTPLEGFLVIEPDIYKDDRGFFLETYQEERYHQAGITDNFVQDNHSRSVKGVLRGMHFQIKKPQAQIVTVMQGEIFDAVVDIRKESKTFGKWYGVRLNAHSQQRQVYMPPGFAHGFCVLSDFADLHYKVSGQYNSNDEGGLNWSDSKVGIVWPDSNFHIKQRDKNFPFLEEIDFE
jgi:dTDP-4-dehydrorhamnose 3,5-epimerase